VRFTVDMICKVSVDIDARGEAVDVRFVEDLRDLLDRVRENDALLASLRCAREKATRCRMDEGLVRVVARGFVQTDTVRYMTFVKATKHHFVLNDAAGGAAKFSRRNACGVTQSGARIVNEDFQALKKQHGEES